MSCFHSRAADSADDARRWGGERGAPAGGTWPEDMEESRGGSNLGVSCKGGVVGAWDGRGCGLSCSGMTREGAGG